MDLHDEPVIEAHACHFHEHVRLELPLVIGIGFFSQRALEKAFGVGP
jgi:hypothetical protein